ncbi:MAG: HEAT repeat domain-containing protein [Gammaproteobacteria bacterium]|nr:HEAT repeat domain-containing protein [Gammaproteobacteria bacterium]
MNVLLSRLILLSVLLLIGVSVSGAAESADVTHAQGDIDIEMNGESLTVEVHDAPLNDVVRAIATFAGFEVTVTDPSTDFPLVTASFENISVLEAVERLLDDTNRVIFYEPTINGGTPRVISELWLVGAGSVAGDGEENDFEGNLDHTDIKKLNEAVLRMSNQTLSSGEHNKEQVLSRLVQVLQGAEHPIVRARAAIALGNLHDQEAVPALEAALLDEHASVRLQAINALGQIGGERATMALGNVLLYGSTDRKERVTAAQALGKQDTEMARRYLNNVANDADELVRLMSSKKPASSQGHILTDQQESTDN